MKTITADKSWDGRKLVRFLQKTLPSAGAGQIRKFLRLGRVKVNSKKGNEEIVLAAGDSVALYVEDEWFAEPQREDPFYSRIVPKLSILYEDENILLLDKKPGLVCHPDEGEKVHTLLTYAQAYLYQKGEWNPKTDFAPALCNRIDRFTGGVVILAKNEAAAKQMDAKLRTHEVEKYYLCIAHGRFKYPDGELRHWLLKPPGQKKVRIVRKNEPGAKEAITYFRVCDEENGLSLVECLLGTGRTHQIRAQLAAIGHPLLGDNQYGDPKQCERFGRVSGQALCAYKLRFTFESDAGCLNNLDGLCVQVRDVPFVRQWFPEVVIPRENNDESMR